jgi:RNA polymerase sigma-70 factor (ECF subfamily)
MLKGSDVYEGGAEREAAARLAELYEANFDRVWRWLEGFGVRHADLEDAAQEVFLVAHRKLAEFDGRAKVTTWLFGIASRVASQFRRRAHVRREAGPDGLDAALDATPAPDDAAAAAQWGAHVARILDGLDANKRIVFVLYELEELTLREIAELVGAPLQTVNSRLRAAREYFRAEAARLELRAREEGR